MHFALNLPRGVDKRCPRTTAKRVPIRLTEAQLRGMFKLFDANKDGRLSREELKNAFNYLGSYVPGWRAGRALYHADENDDGYISEDELDELVKYAYKYGYTVK